MDVLAVYNESAPILGAGGGIGHNGSQAALFPCVNRKRQPMSQNPILVNSRISLHLDYSEVRCQCRLDGSPECTGGILRAETAMIFEKLQVAVSSNIGRE